MPSSNHSTPQATRRAAPSGAPSLIRSGSRSTRGDSPWIGSDWLVRLLPDNYTASTSHADRLEHFELYKRFEASDAFERGDVLLSWTPLEDFSGNVMLHAVFRDTTGSLSTITSAVAEKGVDVKRVVAFTTSTGIAVDSFELSCMDQSVAEHLKKQLRRQIQLSMPSKLSSPASALRKLTDAK